MKSIRPLLIGLLAVVAVLVVAVSLAFVPAVQRWAVLRAVAGQPGMTLAVERVSAGLSTVELRGVRYAADGVVVQLGELRAGYALWPILSGQRLEIRNLTATGVTVDATGLGPSKAGAGAAAAPVAAPGALGQVQLPWSVVLENAEVRGRALLPGAAGQPPITAEFSLTGGGVAPGQEGRISLKAAVSNPAADAIVDRLEADVVARLIQSAERTFPKIELVAVVDASGPGLSEQNQLRVEVAVENASGGESYAVKVDTLQGGARANLLTLQARLPAGGEAYRGEWSLKARTAQVQPFFLAGELPAFEAEGGGRFEVSPAKGEFALAGMLSAAVRQLEVIEPALRSVGPVTLRSRFDLVARPDTARLNELSVSLDGAAPVLELRTTRPLTFRLQDQRLTAEGDESGEGLRLRLVALPLAWVRPFVSGVDVSGGVVTGEVAVQSEGNRLSARTIQPLKVDGLNVVEAGRPWLRDAVVGVDFEAFSAADRAAATLRSLEVTTPGGDRLALRGEIQATPGTNPDFRLTASYEARLREMLAPIPGATPVQAGGEIDATLRGENVRVTALRTQLRSLDGQPMLSVMLLKPFDYLLTPGRLADGVAGELVRVQFDRVALAPLAGPFMAGVTGAITGGEFTVEAQAGGWKLLPRRPLTITGLEIIEAGKPTLGGLGVELSPVINMRDDGSLTATLDSLSLKLAGGAALATAKGEVTQGAAGTRANVTFQLEVPALAKMPAFATLPPVTQGRVSGEVRAALAESGDQVEARVTVNGMVAGPGNVLLPVANISLRASRDPDGTAKVDVPVLLDRAGVRSDLTFAATLARGGPGHVLTAKLSGRQASVDDLMAVVGALSATGGATAPAAPAPATSAGRPANPSSAAPSAAPATSPLWSHVSGAVAIDVGTLTYGPEWTVNGLKGELTIAPDRVALTSLAAAFGEKGRLEAKGDLRFSPGERPYRLGADFSLTEIDAGPLFRAIDPSRPPTLEGRVNMTGKFAGTGRTIDDTLERTSGEFHLASRQGVFRGLKRGTEKVSTATRAVELGAALGSIFGSDRVREAAEKVAGNAYFADQLAQEFGELKYDQFSLRVTRDESLDIKLGEVSLISPEVRLLGKGSVKHVEGRPLLDQPLNVEMVLFARGKVESLLNRARLVEGPRDDLGFVRAKYPVVVGGSMAKPDALSFYTRLATAKLVDSLAPEN